MVNMADMIDVIGTLMMMVIDTMVVRVYYEAWHWSLKRPMDCFGISLDPFQYYWFVVLIIQVVRGGKCFVVEIVAVIKVVVVISVVLTEGESSGAFSRGRGKKHWQRFLELIGNIGVDYRLVPFAIEVVDELILFNEGGRMQGRWG